MIVLEKSSRVKKRIVKVKEKDKTISRKKNGKRSKSFFFKKKVLIILLSLLGITRVPNPKV